ncbi:MAG: hypothetical protein U1E49_04595 [Hyphomicrobiaceae bacterium]
MAMQLAEQEFSDFVEGRGRSQVAGDGLYDVAAVSVDLASGAMAFVTGGTLVVGG